MRATIGARGVVMTQYRCTLYRVRPGLAGFFGHKRIGLPAVYDMDLSDGGRPSVRDVITAMMRADRPGWHVEDYRLRVEDPETGEHYPEFAATARPSLDDFTDEEMREELRHRRVLRDQQDGI